MATSSSLQPFKEFEESMGLTGAELLEFVKNSRRQNELRDRLREKQRRSKDSSSLTKQIKKNKRKKRNVNTEKRR